jgi:predicted porin
MKKTLVAIAALAAFGAQAQSSVTMSGIVDLGYQSINNLGGQKTNQVGQSGARTTTVKLNGTEDLGAGMSANFQFEVQPSYIAGNGNAYNATYPTTVNGIVTTGAQATNAASAQSGLVGKGASFVGLKDAKFGEIQFGTINTGTFATFAAASPLGTGVGSGYGAGNTFGDFTRVESSMAYFTPTYSGFNARIQKGTTNDNQWGAVGSTSTGVVLRRPSILDMAASYTNGPLAVRFGRLESTATGLEATNPGVTTTTQLLSGVYDAGVAKLSIANGTIKNNAATAANYKVNSMGVTVPFGANRVIAQTGSVKYSEGATTSVNVGDSVKTSGIAFERDLSKRTFVYARYETTDLKGNPSKAYIVNGAAATSNVAWGTVDSKRTVTTVGISHAF